MALDAFPVVGIEVQPGERIGLVASGATWRLGDPAGAVRAVALGAAAIDLGVRSLFCGLVAASATPRGRLARVWFVARRALLVSAGGALVFFGVAAVAALLYARAVGIVTALTAGVPPIDLSRLPLVAGLAGLHCEGFVRKASVALATLAVAFALGRQGHLLSVAARASGRVVLGQPKLVRCVAAHAGHCLGVESLVASRVRVAARAGSRSGSGGKGAVGSV